MVLLSQGALAPKFALTAQTCEEHIIRAVFTRDGERIAASTRQGTVYMFDIELEQPLFRYENSDRLPFIVSTSPAHDFLLVTDISDVTNRTTHTFVLNMDGEVVHRLPGGSGSFLGDDLLLTNGGGEGAPASRLWDVSSGEMVERLDRPFLNPIISPNQDWMLLVPNLVAGYAEIWSLPDFEVAFTFPFVDVATGKQSDPLLSVYHSGVFSSDRVAIAGGTGVSIWSLEDFELETVLNVGSPVKLIAFSDSGRYLLTTSGHLTGNSSTEPSTDTALNLWLTDDLEEPFRTFSTFLNEGTGDIQSLDFSPDESRILIVHGDNRLRTWDTDTGTLLSEYQLCD